MSAEILSLIAKPAYIRAHPPATPTTVIKNLFLYLKMFLAVTFEEKFNLFHIKPICSRNIFFPFFGDLGLIRDAGTSLNA